MRPRALRGRTSGRPARAVAGTRATGANLAPRPVRCRRRPCRARRAECEDPRASSHSSPFGSLPRMAKAAPVVGAQSRRVLLVAGGVVLGIAALFVLASVAEHVMY